MEKEINFGQFLVAIAIVLLAVSIFVSTLILVGKLEEMISVSIQLVGAL